MDLQDRPSQEAHHAADRSLVLVFATMLVLGLVAAAVLVALIGPWLLQAVNTLLQMHP